METKFFIKMKTEMKYIIQEKLSDEQLKNLTNIILDVSEKIKEYGLIQ